MATDSLLTTSASCGQTETSMAHLTAPSTSTRASAQEAPTPMTLCTVLALGRWATGTTSCHHTLAVKTSPSISAMVSWRIVAAISLVQQVSVLPSRVKLAGKTD